MRLVGVREDLVEFRADQLLTLDQSRGHGVNCVLLLMDEPFGLFVQFLQHLVREDKDGLRISRHRAGR